PAQGFFVSSVSGQPAPFASSTVNGTTTFVPPPGTFAFGKPINTPFLASGPQQSNSLRENIFPLQPNAQVTAAALQFAQQTIAPTGVLTFVTDTNFTRAVVQGPGTAAIANFYDYRFQSGTVSLNIPVSSGGV